MARPHDPHPWEVVPLNATKPAVASRLVELQVAAYSVEADLIGTRDIPPLHDTAEDVARHKLQWVGVSARGRIVGALGYTPAPGAVDIDRLMVDPDFTRGGIASALIRHVATGRRTTVSTGAANEPGCALYESLGFHPTGTKTVAPGVVLTQFERDPERGS